MAFCASRDLAAATTSFHTRAMALTGDLGSIDLANVFQMLQLSQKTGTLEVRSRGGRTEVYLDGESVLYPFDRDAFPQKVIKLLERGGRISAEQLAKAQASKGILKRDIFTMLLSMKAVTQDDITAAYREQMEEEIYELFVDRDAGFEYRENQKPSAHGKVIDDRYRLNGAGLIMEAARRLDEWGFIRKRVPAESCVFELGGKIDMIPENEQDGAMLDVVAALDGQRSVNAIVDQTGLTRFSVCKKLAILAEMRVVYEVPLEVLVERARQCLREQKNEVGLALLERAFEVGGNEAAVHEMAALANQALKRIGEACRHYAQVAESLERAGERRGAAEVHLRVRDLMPTDVRSRERLVHHWLDDPDFFKDTSYSAETEVTELVVILKEIGRGDDARALLLEVQARFKEDGRVISRLADLSLELGDPKIAVEMLMGSADELFKLRQAAAALRLYRRVRTIDPGHEGLELRIESCEHSSRRPSRTRNRRPVKLAVAFVALAGLAAAFSIHNKEAFTKLAEIPTEDMALTGDFDTALSTLDNFRTEHPITLASLIARDQMTEIEGRARLSIEENARHRDQLALERNRRQRAAERAYTQALDYLSTGNQQGALEQLERAAELASDPAFLAEKNPTQKAQQIRIYLRQGQELLERYEKAQRDQDHVTMHRLGVELLRERPVAPQTQGLMLPVRISTDPSDAVVKIATAAHVEPRIVGSGTVVLLPAGKVATVSASRADRFPQTIKIEPEHAFDVILQLDRRPGLHIELPTRARHRPAVAGDRAYFACADGRVVALDTKTLKIDWQQTLADLEEPGGAPRLDEQGLRIPTRSGRVVWLDPVTGEEFFKQKNFGGSPATPNELTVALPDGGAFVADAEGRIVLRDKAGAPLAAWRALGGVDWGVLVPGGALYGGGTTVMRLLDERP